MCMIDDFFLFPKYRFEMAKEYFVKVYKILADKQLLMEYPKKWEPLLNNLGHVHRKLTDYDDAINYFKIALRMIPENSSTLDALGLVYSLKGERQMASDYFQKVNFFFIKNFSPINTTTEKL